MVKTMADIQIYSRGGAARTAFQTKLRAQVRVACHRSLNRAGKPLKRDGRRGGNHCYRSTGRTYFVDLNVNYIIGTLHCHPLWFALNRSVRSSGTKSKLKKEVLQGGRGHGLWD